MLPDFDTANIEELSAQRGQDDLLLERINRVLERAHDQDKQAIATIAIWLTTFNQPQPIKLDYIDANPVVHEAIAFVRELTDIARLELARDLLTPIFDEITIDEDAPITPPDCEFDDGLPKPLGNEPPSLMIA